MVKGDAEVTGENGIRMANQPVPMPKIVMKIHERNFSIINTNTIQKKHQHHVELLFCMKLFTNGEIPSNASTKIQLKLTERPLDINLMVSAAIWCVNDKYESHYH